MMPRTCARAWLLLLPPLAACGAREVSFRVGCNAGPGHEACAGRLVVYVLDQASALELEAEGESLAVAEEARGLFGVDAASAATSGPFVVDDRAVAYPRKPSALPAGKYRAQAVLDMHQDDSNWQREPGNLYSDPVSFEVGLARRTRVDLTLRHAVVPRQVPELDGVELFSVPSELLSAFRGRPATLRAGVVFPREYDATRSYPAIYEVPYFGGDALDAFELASRDASGAGDDLARSAFQIVLDSESGNGPTLFANSDNNGPCGDALVRELIPALEARYHLRATPEARLLRGHSSGGWAVLWLQMMYPEVFGASWSSSPDPVDFRKLQLVDIYTAGSMYSEGARDWPSIRDLRWTIRQENLIEEVLGPNNSSGQQWDSWQAVWGTRDAAGHVRSLFDPWTGALDHAEAERYRRHDITEQLKLHASKYGPLFLDRIHVLVGGDDDYYLNEAVELLAAEVARLPGRTGGYVKVVAGYDHHTIRRAPEYAAAVREMLVYSSRGGGG
jgi:Putative esterase